MNILVVTNMYPTLLKPENGTFVKNITNGLSKRFPVTLLKLNTSRSSKISKAIAYLSLYVRTFVCLLKNTTSIVYLHFPSHTGLPIVIFSLFFKVRLISNYHGGDAFYQKGRSKIFFKLKRLLNEKIISKSDLIVVPSEHFREQIESEYKIGSNKFCVSFSGGVNTALFNGVARINNPKKIVGFVGRLVELKNPDLFIELIERFKENSSFEIDAKLIGSGPLRDKIRDKAANANIELIDSLSQEELAIEYKKIDILVQCSDHESLGLVAIEGLISGCIPMFWNKPHYYYLVEDRRFLFDTIADFQRNIERLLNMEPKQWDLMRKQFSKSAEDKFSAENVIGNLVSRIEHEFK